MGKVLAGAAALIVLVALWPSLCVSAEGGPSTCRSLVLPLPWGDSADTWGMGVAVVAAVLTFLVGLRLSRWMSRDDS